MPSPYGLELSGKKPNEPQRTQRTPREPPRSPRPLRFNCCLRIFMASVGRRLFFSCCFVAASCSRERATDNGPRDAAPPPVGTTLFTRLPSTYTGVSFENRLVESRELNVFTYRNFYNGGGVAIGVLTGDSLPEIVLTSNQDGPRVYLN